MLKYAYGKLSAYLEVDRHLNIMSEHRSYSSYRENEHMTYPDTPDTVFSKLTTSKAACHPPWYFKKFPYISEAED